MKVVELKMANTTHSVVFVLSFATSAAYVAAMENEIYLQHPIKERRAILRDVYRSAKLMQKNNPEYFQS